MTILLTSAFLIGLGIGCTFTYIFMCDMLDDAVDAKDKEWINIINRLREKTEVK